MDKGNIPVESTYESGRRTEPRRSEEKYTTDYTPTPEAEIKPKKNSDLVTKVILVQLAVCAFIVALIFAAWKFCPNVFSVIKSEYSKIMSVDIGIDDVRQTIDNAAAEQQATGEEEQYEVSTEAATEAQSGEGGEDTEIQDTAIAVMTSLGDSKDITVPLHGRISSKYGYRTNPISGVYGLHTGVDIAADEGSPIVAAYNGVVKDTGVGEKRGKYILMLHNDGSETLYCHCSKITVDEDEVIRAGEVIALVGSTGWSTGPHLHFEIHRNGSAIDPLTVIDEEKI